jgi:hypothetical protein
MRSHAIVSKLLPPLVLGCIGGLLVTHNLLLAVAFALAFLSVGFAWVPGRIRFFKTPYPFRWIPVAWVVLLFVSNIKFQTRDPSLAASGQLSAENAIELVVYLLVALVVIAVWYHLRPQRTAISEWPVIAWPLFAVASASWSIIPLFTFVRATQLVVVGSFAILCLRLAGRQTELRSTVLRDSLRAFIFLTGAMSVWGLLDRSTWLDNRFVWPTGQHPILVGISVGAALILVVVGGRPLTRLPLSLHSFMVVLFGLVLILCQSRSVLISTSVGLLASPWLTEGRRKYAARFVVFPSLLYGAFIIALFAGQSITEYLRRGESAQSLESFTGRTDLWSGALGQLSSHGQWLHGFGYGSSRVILVSIFSWGGEAHSALIELLLGVGVIGTGIALVSIAKVGYRALSDKHASDRVIGAAEGAAFIYLLIVGLVEAAFVVPGFSFVLLMLLFLSVSSPQPVAPTRSKREHSASVSRSSERVGREGRGVANQGAFE